MAFDDDDDRLLDDIICNVLAPSDDDDRLLDDVTCNVLAPSDDDDRLLDDVICNVLAPSDDDYRLLDDVTCNFLAASDDEDRLLDDILLNSTAAEDDDDDRLIDDILDNSTAAKDDDDRLLDDILRHSTAASSSLAHANARFFDLNSPQPPPPPPPPPPYWTQGHKANSLHPQMDSDGDGLLDDIICHSLATSDNDDHRLFANIFRHSTAASSSLARAPTRFFDLKFKSLQPPPPMPLPAYWTLGSKVNWLLLPQEVLSTVLLKLGAVEIIESAQKVCTLWRSVSMDPSLWTRIGMRNDGNLDKLPYNLALMCRHAVNRSRGGCIDISIEYFGDDYLLDYIVNSGCQLRRLQLVHCLEVSNEGLSKAAMKLPLLETFENYYGSLSEKALVAIGQNCPHLTTLKFIKGRSRRPRKDMDKEAFAIAEHMPGLHHLTLIGNKLTNTGLKAILDGCPHLESLDLRQSYNVDLRGDIAKKCGLINNLRHPLDPFDGHGSDAIVEDDYEAYSPDSMGSYDSSDYSYHSPPPPPPRYWTRGPKPNWLALPRAVLTEILLKLGAFEIIESAQKVCTQWRSVCMDPTMWTHIDMWNLRCLHNMPYNLIKMCRHAIDRSRGGCVDINMENCGDDDLLNYIIESGCKLRRLRLVRCWSVSNEGMAEAAPRLPFLETFEYYRGDLKESALTAIGKNCPRLTTLRYEHEGCQWYNSEMDDEALAIAKHMPGLHHLSLLGNKLTNKGLRDILDSCPHLESLDLRQCFNVDLKGTELAKICERIKDLKLPSDSTPGYKFSASNKGFNGHDLSCVPFDNYSGNIYDGSSDYSDYHPEYDYLDDSYDHSGYFSF